MRTPPAVALAVSLLLAACGRGGGSSEPAGEVASFNQAYTDAEAYPVIVSSELTVGRNRFVVGLLDSNDAPMGDPSIEVSIDFYDLERSATEPQFSRETSFVWIVKGRRGLYVTHAQFDSPGKWGTFVHIRGDGIEEDLKGSFEVTRRSSTPALGKKVPASDTPTASGVRDLSEITTDPHPDLDFYRLSIADALRAGKPFVVVFATPKFCTSAVCGPTLDVVKRVAPEFPGINFIHVEVYSNLDDPSNLKPVPAVRQWGLPTEPWVFLVDSSGRLAAKYEGVVSAQELRADLRRVR